MWWLMTSFLLIISLVRVHANALVGSGPVADETQVLEIEGTLMVNCSGVTGINLSYNQCSDLGEDGIDQGVCIHTEGNQYLPCPCAPLMKKLSRQNQRCAGLCPALHSLCREETIYPTTPTPTKTVNTPDATTTSDYVHLSSTAEVRETHSWIAAVVVVAILIVIGLVIGTVKVITYYKCNKMCPLPFHSCSVDYPLFKLIKCCCKDYLEARPEENPENGQEENFPFGQPPEEN